MNALLTAAMTYVAMACVCLSMERHQEQVLGRPLAGKPTWCWRLAGWILLAVALVPAIALLGTSIGIAAWLGMLTFAALALGLQLTYLPHSLRWLGPFSALLVVCILIGRFAG